MSDSLENRLAFFVQNNLVNKLTIPVATYARKRNFGLEDRSSSNALVIDDCGIDWTQYKWVIPYGSVHFLRKLKESSLAKFILHDEASFATSSWSAKFGDDALNSSGQEMSVVDVSHLLLERDFLHIRPDSVDKAFNGGICNSEDWELLRLEKDLLPDLRCWVSPVRYIYGEWRCWVIDGEIIEISQYREKGNMQVRKKEGQPEILEAAQRLADKYVPAPCVVLDMALTDSGYKLVEFNPIHCSGWYAANVDTILDAWVSWYKRNT